MSRKFAILIAVLAITSIGNATVGTGSPSSAYSVASANVFLNATDTAFTNIQPDCTFTAGFDNTTNYVWCQAQFKSGGTAPADLTALSWPYSGGYTAAANTVNALILQRRAINASSPGTKNATLDAKITTSIMANDGGVICGGVGYIGIAYGYGAGASNTVLQSDVSFSYIAVNGTTVTTVKLTAADATMRSKPQACMFDNGIFYIMYTVDSNSATAPVNTNNKYMIQGVNVTSGLVYYNSTGGVAVLTYTAGVVTQYTSFSLMATNWTGYGSTLGLLTYYDLTTAVASATVGASTTSTAGTWKVIPITLATGAPGSAVTLGVTGTSTTTITGVAPESPITTSTTAVATTWSPAGGFGSLSTYGVVATKQVDTTITKLPNGGSATSATTSAYSSSIFINGSSTASTTFNLTDPTGYHLMGLTGYSTAGGFGLLSMYGPTNPATTTALVGVATGTTYQWNKDTYYANGTAILSAVSLGTFDNGYTSLSPTQVTIWIDAAGSPWLGYITQDTAAAFTDLDLIGGYAGQIALNVLNGGTVLTSIFATLTFIIAALFAF